MIGEAGAIVPPFCPIVVAINTEGYLGSGAQPSLPIDGFWTAGFGIAFVIEMANPGAVRRVAIGLGDPTEIRYRYF